MFRKILGTLLSKGFVAFISFGTLLLTTHNLGTQGRGDISIISTVVGLMGLVNGFVGGGAIVYLMPRHKNQWFFIQAIFFSVLWAILVCFIGTLLYKYGYQLQSGYGKYVLCLGLLTCIYSSLQIIIFSHEDIKNYNIIGVLQPSLNFIFFAVVILFGYVGVSTFIYSLSLSYICALLIEVVILKSIGSRLETTAVNNSPIKVLRKIVLLGSISQLGNLIQYLNYRFSYFVINAHTGASGVGIYSVGVSISESVWILAQSISLVQYSTIANSQDEEYVVALTVKLAKLSSFVTFLIIFVLVLIPGSVFSFIFGKEFGQVRTVLLYLGPGIVLFGFGMILSHYFAGKGQYSVNTIAALIGLIISIPGCFLMIPWFGYLGAAITASLSYFIITIYQLVVFMRKTKTNFVDLKFNRDDWYAIKRSILTIRNGVSSAKDNSEKN